MLRGLRWQFLVFVLAVVLFVFALMSQPTVVEVSVTSTPAPITPSPVVEVTVTPSETAVIGGNRQTATPIPLAFDVPTYREGLVGGVRRLNPLLRGTNPAEDDITSLIFEGLIRTNQYGEPVPALAREWSVANNRLEYVFQLREDVLWQDGMPFTARDVAFTMGLLRDPNFPGDPALGEFWQTVETEVLNDYVIRFRLAQPLGSFLDALRIGILPEHALVGTRGEHLAEHPFNLTPIGTGAYQLEAIRAEGDQIRTIDLRAAPTFQQRPEGRNGYGIERVRFEVYPDFDTALNAFSLRDVDGLAAPTASERSTLLSIEAANIFTKLDPTLGILIFNWQRPEAEEDAEVTPPPNPFREERVRDALVLALNRESIVQRNMLNRAVIAENPLLPGSWAFASDIRLPDYNPDEARFLLETARLPGANRENEAAESAEGDTPDALITFSILVPDRPELVQLAQEIADQWSQYGLDVSVTAEPPSDYRQRLESGDFDTAIVELSLGNSSDPDVYSFWHQGQFPDGNNYGAVDDRRISETLERARRDPGGINRIEYYRRFQDEFVNRSVAIPLYYPLFTYAVHERVDNVQVGFIGERSDRLRTIRDWIIR